MLLILAGVSISLILDENGIIQKSKEARREYKQAQANEQSDIDNISEWLEEETLTIVEPANIADWEYTEEDDGTITINTYKGSDTTVVIPNYINGKPVKKIESAKTYCYGQLKRMLWDESICSEERYGGYFTVQKTIKEIVISEGIQEIGEKCFTASGALEQITIPKSVTSIGINAFQCCTELKNITIPESVTTIKYDAFIDIPSITVNVPFKEGETPEGWDADWNHTDSDCVVTVNYLK